MEHFEPSITLLNRSGDVTISWDDNDKDAVAELIDKKIADGYSFFIVREPGARGAPPKLKAGESLNRAVLNKLLVSNTVAGEQLDDADLMVAMQNKLIVFSRTKREPGPITTTRRASNGQEVVSARSVAIRPIHAG